MKKSLSRLLLILVFSITSLGMGSQAFATDLIVDLITDWEPGSEFTGVQATVDVDNNGSVDLIQSHPVYTTDDTITGIRIADFDVPNGVHRVVVSLLRPDETVLDSKATIVSVSGATAVTSVMARTGAPQPVCAADLSTVIAERDQCVNNDLPTCEGSLSTCEGDRDQCVVTDLPACVIDRDNCQDAKMLCDMGLDTCNGLLDVCNTSLSSLESDDDADGIIAVLDICPATPASTQVDATGCSQAQFCSSISIFTPSDNRICRRADWKNDEPTSINPGDCDVGSAGSCESAE